MTYVFCQEIALLIIINIKARVPALESQRPEAPFVGVFPARCISSRDSDFRIAIIAAVDVHPQYIFIGAFVVDDLGSFDDPLRSEISASLTTQKGAFVFPFDEVGGAVAVHVLKSGAIRLVFADPVELLADAL